MPPKKFQMNILNLNVFMIKKLKHSVDANALTSLWN